MTLCPFTAMSPGWMGAAPSTLRRASARIAKTGVAIVAHGHADRVARGDIDAFSGHFGEEVDLLFGDHIGRQEIHHAAQRAQQGAPLPGVLVNLEAAPFL